MRILGFNFTKISGEKGIKPLKEVNVNSNIDIKEIKEADSDILKSKDKILGIKFVYDLAYEPDVAKLSIEGVLILSIDPKEAKDILKDWKDNIISDNFKINVFNIIMRKSNLKALTLEEDLNLPLHISFPVLRKQEKMEK